MKHGGETFDLRNTPSKMGALSEFARNHPEAVRTGHPFYSFVTIGKNAHLFENLDNRSGYGLDSPFGVLMSLKGKIGVLGLDDQSSMTFYHFVEEQMQVKYRYFKEFTGEYINLKGEKSVKTYSLYVRDLEKNVITRVNPMGERLWQLSLYRGSRYDTPNFFRTIKRQF